MFQKLSFSVFKEFEVFRKELHSHELLFLEKSNFRLLMLQ